MAPSSEERNAKGNKYVVNVKPSSTPNRRFLVVILAAAALVTIVVLLATLIPIYVTGNEEDKSNEQLSDRQRDDNFLTSNSKGPSIKGESTTRRHSFKSVSTIDTTTSKHEEGSSFHTTNTLPSEMVSPSMAIRTTKSTQASVSSSINFVRSSAKQMETSWLSSARASSLQHGKTSPLPKDTSLTTDIGRISDTPIISSASDISSTSIVEDLSVIANLVPNTESKWTRWSPWSDCTKTCGTGTRHRTRKCVAINQRAVFAPISCAGKPTEKSSCAEWSCPDCSKTCTNGTLNAACDACTCDQHLLTGRILTEDNIPLSEANISFAETPYSILAQTNVSGYFSSLGVCANDQQEFLIAKEGFVPVKLKSNVSTTTTATITAKLEIAVPPFVTVHPKSKIRMSGQSVTFCCIGEGNPPPEIEWFKENNIIDKDLYNYNNILEIPDVAGLNGSFRCRVINQFGSEFSTTAELTVFEKSVDSCSSTPISKNETLPAGCTVKGTNITTVDVGECEPVACVKGNSSFNSSCTDSSLCCGSRSFEKVLVQCGALLSFDLSIVKTCGCGKCIEKETVIEGIAVGQDDRAAKSIDVFFAGKSVDSTDENGKFSFVVPKDTRRAIVTFKDQTNKIFEEEDKTFIVNEGEAVQYRVKLREKPKPITFNASEPLLVPLGGGESDSFADLELPENALLNEDGSVFNGSAKARVSVTDPRNESDVSSAPGDFSTTSEDGEEEILETFGMMKLNLEDDSGKPLSMSKPMKVYLDPEKLNITLSEGNVSVKLYWLDKKTGRWREAGELFPEHGSKRRRKRSNRVFLAGTVAASLTKHKLNLDTPTERIGLRVSLYKQTDEAVVRVICKEKDPQGGQGRFKGYLEKNTVRGVICHSIWKRSICYVQAEKQSEMKYYDPDKSLKDSFNTIKGGIVSFSKAPDSKITISSFEFSTFDYPEGKKVPLYNIDRAKEMKDCKKAHDLTAKEGSQFVFKSPTAENSALRYSMLSIDTKKDSDWSLFYEKPYNCFIKVIISGKDAVFMAVSYPNGQYKAGQEYGLHVRESGKQVVCLRFRCPADRFDKTVVLVAPMITQKSVTCRLSGSQPSKCNDYRLKAPPHPVTNGAWFSIEYSDAFMYSRIAIPNTGNQPLADACEKAGNHHCYVNYDCS